MAFASSDNFESYTANASIDGGSGGSNWATNWSIAGAGSAVVQTSTKYQGSKALKILGSAGDAETAVRTWSSESQGTLYIACNNVSNNDDDGAGLTILSGSTNLGPITLYKTSTNFGFYFYNGGDVTIASGLTAGNWYVLKIEWDNTNQANKLRFTVHDGSSWGTPTSWLNAWNSFSSVDKLQLRAPNTTRSSGCYFDVIQATDPTVTSTAYTTTQTSALAISDGNSFRNTTTKSDALSIADVVSNQSNYIKLTTDALSLSDAVTKSQGNLLSISEFLTILDEVDANNGLVLSDSIISGDSTTLLTRFSISPTDTTSLSDAVSFGMEFDITVSDTIVTSDNVTTGTVMAISVTETTTLSDLNIFKITFSISDSTSLSDDRSLTYGLNPTEILNISDGATISSAFGAILSDTLNLSGVFVQSGGWHFLDKTTGSTWTFINKRSL